MKLYRSLTATLALLASVSAAQALSPRHVAQNAARQTTRQAPAGSVSFMGFCINPFAQVPDCPESGCQKGCGIGIERDLRALGRLIMSAEEDWENEVVVEGLKTWQLLCKKGRLDEAEQLAAMLNSLQPENPSVRAACTATDVFKLVAQRMAAEAAADANLSCPFVSPLTRMVIPESLFGALVPDGDEGTRYEFRFGVSRNEGGSDAKNTPDAPALPLFPSKNTEVCPGGTCTSQTTCTPKGRCEHTGCCESCGKACTKAVATQTSAAKDCACGKDCTCCTKGLGSVTGTTQPIVIVLGHPGMLPPPPPFVPHAHVMLPHPAGPVALPACEDACLADQLARIALQQAAREQRMAEFYRRTSHAPALRCPAGDRVFVAPCPTQMPVAEEVAPARTVVQTTSAQHARHVHFCTPTMEAHCERMHCAGSPDRVVLEGDVRLTCKREGQPIRIEAQRVLVNVKDGTFTVEGAGTMPVRATSTGSHRDEGVQRSIHVVPVPPCPDDE